MNNRESLAAAAKKALKLRQIAHCSFERPCDVYELIHDQHLELQFFAVPTLEGMYLEDDRIRRVCVSAFRPAGRQRFTAAHELGHSVLMHRTKIDAIGSVKEIPEGSDDEELLANVFASALLMPNNAVHAGFRLRNMDLKSPSPTDLYRVATWLGVGYSTLLNHMCYAMKLIAPSKQKALLRHEPKQIKSEIVRQETTKEVFVLDHTWAGERAHAQVGDFLTGGIRPSNEMVLQNVYGDCFVAAAPGKTVLTLPSGASVQVSVSRESYVGFYDYRYIPEEG